MQGRFIEGAYRHQRCAALVAVLEHADLRAEGISCRLPDSIGLVELAAPLQALLNLAKNI